MTAWDFLHEMAGKMELADAVVRVVFVAIALLIIIEVAPGKAKPLSRMARGLGKALNADVTERISKLEHESEKAEKDSVRLQLLVLFSDYSDNRSEILEVAHHYFHDIKGDWYMTALFNSWLVEKGIGKPEWFDPKD